jgi:hypothetical protein
MSVGMQRPSAQNFLLVPQAPSSPAFTTPSPSSCLEPGLLLLLLEAAGVQALGLPLGAAGASVAVEQAVEQHAGPA